MSTLRCLRSTTVVAKRKSPGLPATVGSAVLLHETPALQAPISLGFSAKRNATGISAPLTLLKPRKCMVLGGVWGRNPQQGGGAVPHGLSFFDSLNPRYYRRGINVAAF